MYIAIVVLLTIVLPLALAIVDRFVMHAPGGALSARGPATARNGARRRATARAG